MNKAELVAAIAAKTGETKKAAELAVNAFVQVVTETLKKGDKVQLVGFGSFEEQAPGGHFLGPLARKRQTQVHIVEDGR